MNELAYVLITPYSLLKSRTGGIIARILTNNDLDLLAVKMYAPSDAMVDEYINVLSQDPLTAHNRELFSRYIQENLRRDNPSNISNRCVLLLFRGENAANIIKRAVGYVTHKSKGNTVRTTYGDYIAHGDSVVYFEPAVLCAPDDESAKRHLRVFKKYAMGDGGVITSSVPESVKRKNCQTTLVMLKPDNFRKRSSRPGHIIDLFSQTGLYIVGAKLVRFSVTQAIEFYKPLRAIFETKLEPLVERYLRKALDASLPFTVTDEDMGYTVRRLRKNNADYEFNRIVEYITGVNPQSISPELYDQPAKERCLALLYHGVCAIPKIRLILGDTNPQTAGGGTVRRDYGQDILRNGVHASDTPRNAVRERKIVGLFGGEPSELDKLIPY